MHSFVGLVSYLLTSMGVTILVVWPSTGPGAWMRERVVRPMLPGKLGGVLDCYLCLSFWIGLAASPLWWWWHRELWCWTGCFMAPAIFWTLLKDTAAHDETNNPS